MVIIDYYMIITENNFVKKKKSFKDTIPSRVRDHIMRKVRGCGKVQGSWEIRQDRGSLCGSDGEECACSAGDPGLIPRSGRSLGEGNGYPLQYSCLENPVDRGAWWATARGTAKSRTWLSGWAYGGSWRFQMRMVLSCVGDQCVSCL